MTYMTLSWRGRHVGPTAIVQPVHIHSCRPGRGWTTAVLFQPYCSTSRSWTFQYTRPAAPAAVTPAVEKPPDQAREKFILRFDVGDWKPEEIRVKVKEGGIVEIKARRESADGGEGSACKLSKEAQWEYLLPKDVEGDTIQSFLSSDGMLTLEAQRKLPMVRLTPFINCKEKEIPVQLQQTLAVRKLRQLAQFMIELITHILENIEIHYEHRFS